METLQEKRGQKNTPGNAETSPDLQRTELKPVLSPTMRAAFKMVQWLERIVVKYSPQGNATFFDPKDFPWTRILEDNWQTIRKELDVILEHTDELPNFQDISKDQLSITRDDKWKTFFLYGYGYKSEANAARCPETTKLVEQVPGMLTAFFSILKPGKHIPAHRGPYKGVLRYHLGLLVPEPKERCRIRVGEDVRHWEEGKGMLFDDTHDHEVWNDTEGVRVVLFMDVVRPLRFPASWLNRLIITLIKYSPIVQSARKNGAQWEMSFEDAMNRAK